jgi:hypothetical protein
MNFGESQKVGDEVWQHNADNCVQKRGVDELSNGKM